MVEDREHTTLMSSGELDYEYMGLMLRVRMKEEFSSGPKRVGLSVSKAQQGMWLLPR